MILHLKIQILMKKNSYCVENYAELVWEGTGKRIFEVVRVSEPMKFD